MTHKVLDRVRETTSTTGTGTLTLTGPAPGCVAVADSVVGLTANGDTSWFIAENGTEWEMFLGTRVDATHLERTTFIKSSTGAAVNFTAPPVVFSTVPSERLLATGAAFRAYLSADQSVSSDVMTKVALNTKEFDTRNRFDASTNYRWTPDVAGYYLVEATLTGEGASLTAMAAELRKNGSAIAYSTFYVISYAVQRAVATRLVYMNGSTDYIEWFATINGTSLKFRGGIAECCMSGHLACPS